MKLVRSATCTHSEVLVAMQKVELCYVQNGRISDINGILHVSCLFVARTSGIILVVGVGSYIAYRLCLKYFGPHFLSSLIHQAKVLLVKRTGQELLLQVNAAAYELLAREICNI